MNRPAQLTDALAIAKIQVITWQDAYKGIIPEGFLNRLSVEGKQASWKEQIRDQNIRILVYELDSEVVGFIAGGSCRDDDLDGHQEIYAIYIDPDQQNQGIGETLTNAFLCSAPYSLWVLSANIQTVRFYQKLEFKADGKTKVLDFGIKQVEEKRLVKQ